MIPHPGPSSFLRGDALFFPMNTSKRMLVQDLRRGGYQRHENVSRRTCEALKKKRRIAGRVRETRAKMQEAWSPVPFGTGDHASDGQALILPIERMGQALFLYGGRCKRSWHPIALIRSTASRFSLDRGR